MLDALSQVAGWVKKNFWAKTDNIILRAGQFLRVGGTSVSDRFLRVGGTSVSDGVVEIVKDLARLRLKIVSSDSYASLPILEGETEVANIRLIGSTFSTAARRGNLEIEADAGNVILQRPGASSSGNVGIGTDSPFDRLYVNTGVTGSTDMGYITVVPDYYGTGTGGGAGIRFSQNQPSANNLNARYASVEGVATTQYGARMDLAFVTTNTGVAPSEKMRITGSGNVGIGTTGPSYKLDVSGDINASGSVRSNGTPLTSDGTLKDAPTPTKGALSKLAAVRGYEFTWSDKARQMGLPDGVQHGLIAQEVEQIFPDLVSEWEVETGEYVEGENGEQTPMKERIKCVDYARMVPILLEAVRELAGRVDALSRSSRSPQSAQSP